MDHYTKEYWQDENGDGAGERVSLDQRSKFTLTRFRKSKYTQMFSWLITIMGFWN